MNVIREEIRTGLLVVVSITALVAVLLYLGAPGVFVPQKKYYIYVENASGLKQGADVSVAGRKVGQVLQLFSPVSPAERPAPKLETMVEVRVNRSAKIYKKVNVQITSSSLLGEMFIDFTSGDEDSGEAPPQTSFIAAGPNSISDAVPKILERLDPIVAQANATLEVLSKTAANINRITAPDGDFQLAMTEFRKVGTNLKDTTGPDGSLRHSLDNFEKLTSEQGKISTTLDSIQKILGPGGSLARTLENTAEFTANLKDSQDIKLTLQNSRKATAELNDTLTDLRFKFGAVADNLEQASDTVKRQPWRLIWPSTKKYAEPESPKVRGTVKVEEVKPTGARQKTEIKVSGARTKR